MKNLIVLSILQFVFLQAFAQCEDYCINFEDTLCINRLETDTGISNSWQIGSPQKPLFNTAYSIPNAIVTDTVLPYPQNDSSVFLIKNPVNEGDIWGLSILQGRYNVQTDSLNDYGKMELSADGGQNWIDLLNDDKYSDSYNWWTFKPVLTGNSAGWKYFEVILSDIGSVFDIGIGDTIIFRFTFISDGIPDDLGGLMFDDLCFSSFVEGISEQRFLPLKSRIFPNPSSHAFTIEFDNPENQLFHIAVYNSNSIMQFNEKNLKSGIFQINAASLKPGVYFYKLTNPETLQRSWGKFIVVASD